MRKAARPPGPQGPLCARLPPAPALPPVPRALLSWQTSCLLHTRTVLLPPAQLSPEARSSVGARLVLYRLPENLGGAPFSDSELPAPLS